MFEHSRLEAMDNSKLIDIVKNYKQYGYDDALRNTALAILETRGILQDELKLTGNFSNYRYDTAANLAKAFLINSRWTFIFYTISVLSPAFYIIISIPIPMQLFIVCYLLSVILFCVFLIKSLIARNDFYKTINKELGAGDYLVYLMAGIAIYLFMYFYYRSQMKEELKGIN